MLDFDALAQPLAPCGRGDELSKAVLEPLVVCDGDRAATGAVGRRAVGAHRTSGACAGIEFHDLTEREWLGLSRRTRDGARSHVDGEVAFAEAFRVARAPRLAEDFPTTGEDLRGERTVDVTPVDRKLFDVAAQAAMGDVCLKAGGPPPLRAG